jgi:hypothetical protein
MSAPFKIQKKYVTGLGNWLGRLSLQGRDSRMRTRFVEMLENTLAQIEKDRKAMIEEIGEKDDNGVLKIVEEEGKSHFVIPDELQAKFNTDLGDMYSEDAELMGPESATIFHTVKNIVLNTEDQIEGSIAGQYNEWCKAFEAWNPSEE